MYFPYHSFVSTYCRDEVSSDPKVLSHEIALPLNVDASEMDRDLALDKADHLRDHVFRRYREIIRNMTRHEMAFLNPAFLLEGQFAEYLPKMPSKFHVERLYAALGNEHLH